MSKEILLASNNPHKLKEYREILTPLGYKVLSLDEAHLKEDPSETGKTYEENAYIKAEAAALRVDIPVIADDSGIEISALGEHFPGIHSARYAAEIGHGDYHQVHLEILRLLADKADRSASFYCTICLLEPGKKKPHFFRGSCPGVITREIKGDHGFGYDPIFHSTEGNYDFGTASEEEKNAVSHRAHALAKLVDYLSI
jgi:XTP/dITP diphosphohydrolase